MNRAALFALSFLGSACFDPQFQQGVPCTADGECPVGQLCHTDDRCYDADKIPDGGALDANLSGLEVSLGELVPPFDPQITKYDLELGLRAEELVVTPSAASETASIEVSGQPVSSGSPSTPVGLRLGENTVLVEVTNGNTVKAYEITVDRGAGILQSLYAKASNAEAFDAFGSSLALSGDTLAVGAHLEDSANANNQSDNSAEAAGAVYVFVRDGATWTQQAYLKGSNTEDGDFFGCSVALSGDTLAVGARFEESGASGVNVDQADNSSPGAGAVYVFVRSGSVWTQQAYIKAGNTDAGDLFGTSVALSGDTLVVGAPSEASSATGVNGDQNDDSASQAGAAYVFFRTGVTWAQQAYVKASNTNATDGFGATVTIDGDTLAVGAPLEASAATGVNGNENDNSAFGAGAVYVLVRNGTAWTQQAYVKGSNAEGGDQFGTSVALSADTLAVGAPLEGSATVGIGGAQDNNDAQESGAVYIFVRNGATWSQEVYLKASNTNASDQFGSQVSVSGNGLAVAAHFEDSAARGVNGDEGDNEAAEAGVVYLFSRSAGVWSQRAYIKGNGTEAKDNFGSGLALSGNVLAVSADGEDGATQGVAGNEADNNAFSAGAAYIFE